MERQWTIKKLFHEEDIRFAIPAYQRAYSWEWDNDKKQVKQFIIDIKEQNPQKKYFFGHFLFEKDEHKENRYWVIDGQQRLTTIVIFMSCLIRELEKREKAGEIINDEDGETVDIWRVKELYIRLKKDYKFETVAYDNPFFKSFVYEDNKNIVEHSSSEKRIKKAKKEFEKILYDASITDILNWKKIIDDAVITTFELVGNDAKMQATQIFAFQNDRGKDLTVLEKLKAFLMHKIYSVSENDNPESEIKDIETVFSDIYKQTERISGLSEDAVLSHHCTAYLSGWDAPMDNVKKELEKNQDNKEKEKWIIEFVNNLKETFYSVEEIEKRAEQNCAVADVMILDSSNILPLLIKLFHYHKQNEDLIEEITRKIENILFKLEYKIADYRTNNFRHIAKQYSGNEHDLKNELNNIQISGFQPWWNFNDNCINYFNSTYHYHNHIRYVLWKYENFLRWKHRTRELSPIEYKNKFWGKRLENTVDHITPQNPDFRKYTEDFKNNWLNNIGNLTLMVRGDNSEKRDHNPITKIDLYDSDFYSHKEIRDELNILAEQGSNSFWDEKQITERRDRILSFIFDNWGFNK
ncbi:MAG: DUF262 domain-containing HNH endonuclease family protein [Prevotellaceae bacterium]|jgi:hypothetical protein|nr:DUF262 domain-containing HNH endonuclease family protein [Prevotellaceae bacterium]